MGKVAMMELAVTAEHCTNGKQCNAFYNPVALALQKALGDHFVVVTNRKVHTLTCNPQVVDTPTEVEQWLMHWDNDRASVSPRTFLIPLSLGNTR